MLSLGLLLWAGIGPSGAQSYPVRLYTVDDGLPSGQIRDITQDTGGRMWFATRSGIAVYDGSDWTNFNVAHGLTWADVFALRWDRRGVLWAVGSLPPFKVSRFEDGGWNQATGSPDLGPDARISGFAVSGDAADGWLVLATDGQGLRLRRLGGSREWIAITERGGLPSDEVTALVARGDRFLVATWSGLGEVRGGRFRPLGEVVPDARLPILGLAPEEGPEGLRWWLVGRDWIGRLTDRRFEVLGGELPISLPETRRLTVAADLRGGLYLGHPGALFHFHPEDGLERLGRDNGLLEAGASALFADREGDLWIGGFRGLSKLRNRRFGRFGRGQGLFSDEVTAVFERRDGTLVLGHRGGLTFLEGTRARTLDLRPAGRRGDPRPEPVRDLTEAADGTLWAAVETYGLARIDRNGALSWSGGDELVGSVVSLHIDRRGRLWVGTREGLYRRAGSGFEEVTTDAHHTHVRRIFEAPDGALLLATPAGLYRYDATGGWQRWTCDGEACNSVFAVLPEEDDLLVGTSVGLYRVSGDRLSRVTRPAVEHPVFFLVRDPAGRLWLGIDNGVLRWDGEHLEHFTVRDGLAGRETNRAAGLVDRRGRVWIGTESGVTRYVDQRPGPRPAPPIVSLSHLAASGRQLALDVPQTLDHDSYNLSFHYRAVSLVAEDRIEISSWLEGLESGWQDPEPVVVREIRYTSLVPGQYRLHLKAKSADGVWSEPVSSAAITVARPFWARPWFYLAVVALIGGSLYLGQSHIAQRRYSRLLEAEVEQRLAQLEESEERYRHIFERSTAVKLVLDSETFEILDANAAAGRFYGYRPESLRRRSLSDLSVDDAAESGVLAATESGDHYLTERHRLASGEIRDVETYISPTDYGGRSCLYMIVHDITQRRLAEEIMASEKERLAVTLRSIDDGVITTDARGEILLFNPRAEEITEWRGSDAVGRSLDDVLELYRATPSGEAGQRLTIDLGKPLSLGTSRAGILVRRRGERRRVELAGSPIAQKRVLSGFVIAFRDVTERRKMEDEIARSQKLEALGILAGGIAHDFNNMLTVLLGNLVLIEQPDRPAEDRSRFLSEARSAVMRARGLTQQLLTFSRGGAPIRKTASVADLITDSASFVLSGSALRSDIELAADLWAVEIDGGQISQVLNNLLINAMQAMPEGGTVRITARNTTDPPPPLPAGRYVAIDVADEGMGIPQRHLSRIFDPYFSTKEEGRGLGLTTAYSIAKRHDGLLRATSNLGKGATFSLYLPAADGSVPSTGKDDDEDRIDGGRLLVMDDEEAVRNLTGLMAEGLGWEVELAADGTRALEVFRDARDEGRPFAAVVLDLTIPGGVGGRETIRRLLELDPQVRAVVMSGYSNDPVLADYRRHGFRARLAKPFLPRDLAQALSEVLRS